MLSPGRAVPALLDLVYQHRCDLAAIEAHILERSVVERREFSPCPAERPISNERGDCPFHRTEEISAPEERMHCRPQWLSYRLDSRWGAHDHLTCYILYVGVPVKAC
jgi:hypothetical protein